MSISAAKYEGKIDLRVRNNSHSIALELVEQVAAGRVLRILDVGCASGYFGEALKLRGHEVWGVEPDPTSATQARTRLDQVSGGTIEDFLGSADVADARFDVIIFGDVLEHTIDPADVLRRCSARLKEGGVVIASVPNVAHLAVRVMLLEGRWDYDDRGILDRTHLRFFTKASIAGLFSSAGFSVDALFPVRLPLETAGIRVDEELVKAVRPLVRDDAADVFQYVTLARPGRAAAAIAANERFSGPPKPRVLCLSPVRDWTIGDIRFRLPLSAWMSWHGGEFRLRWLGDLESVDVDWADVVVLQREVDPNILRLIDHWHGLGKRVVLDIDDLLTDLPDFLASHEHAKWMRPHLEAALRSVDLVTTTTARLAAEFARFNRAVAITPNCPLPVAVFAKHYPTPSGAVTLFVASSDSVRVDFLVPALRRLVADPSLSLSLVAIGPPGKALQDAGLPVALIENLSYEHFGSFLAAHDNAIGLIPLDDSHFSGCKSPIKFFDYSQAGLACICSALPPYSDCVEDGVTGLLVSNDVDAWCEAVAKLARSPELRRRLAAAARRMCDSKFSLRVAGDSWRDALSELHSRPVSAVRAWVEPSHPLERERRILRWGKWLLQSALRPRSYARAVDVLSREGPHGVAKRVVRWR